VKSFPIDSVLYPTWGKKLNKSRGVRYSVSRNFARRNKVTKGRTRGRDLIQLRFHRLVGDFLRKAANALREGSNPRGESRCKKGAEVG